jgi:methyl-accepting chemotaxis protein
MNSLPSYDFSALYGALLVPFRNEAFGPELATGLLVVALVVLIAFLLITLPQALRLRAALVAIKGTSAKESEQQKRAIFQKTYKEIDGSLLANTATSNIWQEFRKTLIFRDNAQRSFILASTRPQNFFNPRNLRVQYDFVRSLPNFFVGLGLLGTFVGLIAALTFATHDLAVAKDQEQIKNALSGLLTTTAAKFYISAGGLVASLVLSFSIKIVLKHLQGRIHQINDALEERLFFISEQTITEKQLSVQQDSLEELRLFNTNIAMKIGDAVRNAVQASNDSLTQKLADISDSFARLVDASGESAGKAVGDAMKGAFDSSLNQASEAIRSIAAELQNLPDQLSAATTSIQNAGSTAAQQQEHLAEKIKEAVQTILNSAGKQVSETINQGTQGLMSDLKNTGAAFGNSAEKISAFFEQFNTSGDKYKESLTALADQNAKLETNLKDISTQIIAATNGVTRASSAVDANMNKLLTGISEFTRGATDTSRMIETAQEAIRQTVETLQQQMSQHIQRFTNVDDKLATVFNSIGAHLELQSRQMSERLTTMDQALAGAVNHFEQLIDDLTVAVSTQRTRTAAE